MDQLLTPDFNLLFSLSIIVVTSASTLIGVYLTQRSTRGIQRQQSEAAATLDRERREHELGLERERLAHESQRHLWQRRFELYSEFLACTDQLINLRPTAIKAEEEVEIKVSAFLMLQYKVVLLAPADTAKSCLMIWETAREIATANLQNIKPPDDHFVTLRGRKRQFINLSRRDLGSQGEGWHPHAD